MRTLLALSLTLLAAAAAAQTAPAPSAPSVPAAPRERPTPEALKPVDAALERAEAKVAGLEAAARARVNGTGCPPGIGVKELAGDLRSGRLAKELGGDLPEDGSKLDWQVYHVCVALATGDVRACAESDAIKPPAAARNTNGRPTSYSDDCSVTFHQTRAVGARLRGDPQAPQVCRDALPRLAEFKDAASVDAVCRAWLQDRGGSHEAMLSAMQAGLKQPAERSYLLAAIRELMADPEYCPKMTNGYEAAACRALDEYRRSLAGGAKCASGLCRALSGEGPSACEPYTRTFLRAACLNGYASSYAAETRDAFGVLSDQLTKALDRLDAGAQGPQELAAVGARFERLYAARARLDRAFAAYAPSSASAKPAPAAAPKRSP